MAILTAAWWKRRQEIPAQNMLEDKAVLEDTHRHQATGDSGETGGAKSMGKEAFIDDCRGWGFC